MPLHVHPAPAPALRSVLAALGSPTAVNEAHTPSLRAIQGPLTAELPLPVHVLDRLNISDLAAAGRPPRTRLVGWRFLIRSGDRHVAAADTRLTPDGWAFSHFFEGPYVAATERALRQAESLARPTSRGCCPCRSCTCSPCGCTGRSEPRPPRASPPVRTCSSPCARAPRDRRLPAASGLRAAARADPPADARGGAGPSLAGRARRLTRLTHSG